MRNRYRQPLPEIGFSKEELESQLGFTDPAYVAALAYKPARVVSGLPGEHPAMMRNTARDLGSYIIYSALDLMGVRSFINSAVRATDGDLWSMVSVASDADLDEVCGGVSEQYYGLRAVFTQINHYETNQLIYDQWSILGRVTMVG